MQKTSFNNEKILLTLALAFCCAAGQGQTTAKPADVNIQELNTKWAKFTQYAEQKQINKAVEEGIRISTLFTQNRQYKEAFATCRQMDALIYYNEQEKNHPNTNYVSWWVKNACVCIRI